MSSPFDFDALLHSTWEGLAALRSPSAAHAAIGLNMSPSQPPGWVTFATSAGHSVVRLMRMDSTGESFAVCSRGGVPLITPSLCCQQICLDSLSNSAHLEEMPAYLQLM